MLPLYRQAINRENSLGYAATGIIVSQKHGELNNVGLNLFLLVHVDDLPGNAGGNTPSRRGFGVDDG